MRQAIAALAVVLALCAPAAALAAAQRTFVASTDSDTNPCSRTQPCRSFATAIGQANPGGEVIVLDSAGYGPFTIAHNSVGYYTTLVEGGTLTQCCAI